MGLETLLKNRLSLHPQMLRAKEESDHLVCYQRTVQKPASVMVWGCISAHGIGDVHICEGTINAEQHIHVLETYAAIQTTSFSGKALIISARQCQTTFCTYYNSMAL